MATPTRTPSAPRAASWTLLATLAASAPATALATPPPEPAPTIEGFHPAGTQAALFVLRPNLWADVIDGLDRRFGDVPAVKSLVNRLRAETYEGLAVGARDWGAGLDLDRGVALFKAKDGLRLVAGMRDPKTAEASLRRLHLLDLLQQGDTAATPRCAPAAPFLVCEVGTVSGREGPPAGTAAPAGALSWFWAGAELEGLAQPGVKVERVTGWFTQEGEAYRFGAEAQFAFDTGMKGLPLSPESFWRVLTPKRPAGARPSLVAAASPGFARVDFDFPALIAQMRLAGAQVEASVAPAIDKLEKGLTGEMTFALDGSFLHPVILLGVTPGPAGDAVLPALAELTAAGGLQTAVAPCADAPEQTCVRMDVAAPEDVVRTGATPGMRPAMTVAAPTKTLASIELHTLRIGDTLVIATTAPDAGRRARPDFVSAPWPSGTGEPGAWGVSFPSVAALAGILGADPFFHIAAEYGWIVDLQLVSNLLGGLLDGADFVFHPAPDRARFELTWRTM
jgi:hypothetical protein